MRTTRPVGRTHSPVLVEVEGDVSDERAVVVQDVSGVGVEDDFLFAGLVYQVDGADWTVLLDLVGEVFLEGNLSFGFSFVDSGRRSVLVAWLRPVDRHRTSHLHERHFVGLVSHELFSFDVICALPVLIDASPLVSGPGSESAAPRQNTKREDLVVFSRARLELLGQIHLAIFNLDVALYDG
jgi:hypothetical protein